MSEENIQTTEKQVIRDAQGNELKYISINDVKYDSSSITKLAINILNDMKSIELKIEALEFDVTIAKLARQKLGEELEKELPKFDKFVDEDVESADIPESDQES